jgi:hypothetical protein
MRGGTVGEMFGVAEGRAPEIGDAAAAPGGPRHSDARAVGAVAASEASGVVGAGRQATALIAAANASLRSIAPLYALGA